MCDFPLCFLSSDSPVLAELQHTDMMTNEECRGVYNLGFVVGVQRVKSPEIQSKTADILRKHGFEKESNHLAGKQTQSFLHVPVVCCTVKPSCKGRLKASIIILCCSCTQCWFIVSVYQSHTVFLFGHLKHFLAHIKPFSWAVVCQQ